MKYYIYNFPQVSGTFSRNPVRYAISIAKENIDKMIDNGSQWRIKNFNFIEITCLKYKPFNGATYFKTPEHIKNKYCVINPKNINDNECFKWSILIGLYYKKITKNLERLTPLYKHVHEINTSMLKYPVSLDDIKNFELINNIPINVFSYNKNQELKILYNHKIISSKKIINLLLIHDENKYHYCYITNINRLVRNSSTNKNILCDKCL